MQNSHVHILINPVIFDFKVTGRPADKAAHLKKFARYKYKRIYVAT